jgi:hypothetical protein
MGGTRTQRATFELERFSWDAPDCLGVSGTFTGLGDAPEGEPVLLVCSGDRKLRLPAVAETLSGPPADGHPWQARFAWQEAPVAFDAVTLVLGEEVTIELPEPGATRRRFRRRTLEVRRAERAPVPVWGASATEEAGSAPPAGDVERLRLEAEMLAAQQQAREMTVAAERANEELVRARADLEAERERSAADAQRFRESLAHVSDSIDETAAAERGVSAQLRTELEDAQTRVVQRDAAIGELRRELEAAAAARGEAEAHAEALRDRIDELERAASELVDLRTELERRGRQAEAALDALTTARTATDEARADAERLLTRLTATVEALGRRE